MSCRYQRAGSLSRWYAVERVGVRIRMRVWIRVRVRIGLRLGLG